MISDEVLKKLAKVDKEPIYHVETSITELAEMATELLQRRDADRWIPVTDAEPESFYEVLFLSVENYGYSIENKYGVGYRYDAEFIGQVSSPTHYRPLPAPPQEANDTETP